MAASGNHSSTCTSSRVQDRVLSGATGCCAARGAGDSPRSSRTASCVASLACADAAAAAASSGRRQLQRHPHQQRCPKRESWGVGLGGGSLSRWCPSGDGASPKPTHRVQQWRRPQRCWHVSCASASAAAPRHGMPVVTHTPHHPPCVAGVPPASLARHIVTRTRGVFDCCAWW